jgi:hypothetical protein
VTIRLCGEGEGVDIVLQRADTHEEGDAEYQRTERVYDVGSLVVKYLYSTYTCVSKFKATLIRRSGQLFCLGHCWHFETSETLVVEIKLGR